MIPLTLRRNQKKIVENQFILYLTSVITSAIEINLDIKDNMKIFFKKKIYTDGNRKVSAHLSFDRNRFKLVKFNLSLD
ncbi:hypothetical protein BpHYR1_031517 [Brachionus plicatilis]|uniref:Uncharacterized protein n=1 Tax=Brachionus plicatilis TaxID=10195 RepID=A0A3M7T2C1_BRAPC|nr:hypothetical protein BpHYR1_031517 [Brachionus plicatilis]